MYGGEMFLKYHMIYFKNKKTILEMKEKEESNVIIYNNIINIQYNFLFYKWNFIYILGTKKFQNMEVEIHIYIYILTN